jgi:hypothetical protein
VFGGIAAPDGSVTDTAGAVETAVSYVGGLSDGIVQRGECVVGVDGGADEEELEWSGKRV